MRRGYNRKMAHANVQKVSSPDAPRGSDGQIQLVAGDRVSMRMWLEEEPADSKPVSTRTYETVGFVLTGRAELHIDGRVVDLVEGDSWIVPAGVSHTYKILETFSAIEATSPPA